MARHPGSGACVALLGLLGALGAGCSDSSSQSAFSSASTFDTVLLAALTDANVSVVERPEPEPAPLVELGEALFHDKIMSGNRNISCASCHRTEAGFGDGLPVAVGEGALGNPPNREIADGRLIARNAPPLFNAGRAEQTVAFHDGRVGRDPATGKLVLTGATSFLNVAIPDASLADPQSPESIARQVTDAFAAQALHPVLDTDEMRGLPGENELADVIIQGPNDVMEVWRRIMVRLVGERTVTGTIAGGFQEYRDLFSAAYPAEVVHPQDPVIENLNIGHAVRAIAAYQREDFVALDSRFDRYLKGDLAALSDREKRGALLFFGTTRKGRCANCHNGPLLSDFQFHPIAVAQVGPGRSGFATSTTSTEPLLEDRGRALVTEAQGLFVGDPAQNPDNYKFRTPALRNVAFGAPYFHDGSAPTLRDVIIHYNDIRAGIEQFDPALVPEDFRPFIDDDPGRIAARVAASEADAQLPQTLQLQEDEIEDLVSFLRTLGDPTFLDDPPPASVPSGLPVDD